MGRVCCVLIHSMFLLCFSLRPIGADSVLVTVQTKSQAEMDAITAALDTEAQNSEGPTRSTLGVIEATASRVVDVDSPYLQTVPRSVPTLAMLNQVQYDLATNKWTFTYESMRIDPNDSLNQFKRVLYLTKRTSEGTPEWSVGDTGNTCLLTSTTDADCLQQLATDYTVPQELVTGNDYLVFDETDGVVSVVTDVQNSLLQTVQVTIPHTRIRDYVNSVEPLAYTQEILHPTEGLRKQYVFGIGMLFYGSGSNQIIFDQFHLIENNREQVAISRETTYAVAQHVSFWTQQVKHDPATRVVLIEYLLDAGHELNSINASINGQQVGLETDCAEMQARIDALENSACLTQYPLCVPQTYVTTTDGQVQTWASYVLPLPAWASSPFRINTLLNTTADDRSILSTLNFETGHEPTDVCANAVAQEFSPSDHVSATVYRGQALVPTLTEGYFTVDNTSAIGMPDALMTLVLEPRDAAAVAYFTEFQTEYINLDEVYMSHALDESLLPPDLSNSMTGASGGRAELVLDSNLLTACPLETTSDYDPSPDSANTCVTTKDWAIEGQLARAYTPHMYFVRRVTGSEADQNWLAGNIFAEDTASAQAFLAATLALIKPENQGFAQTYWIWPIFQWPGASPIGLKDTTLVSFAWSVSSSPPPSSLRRLLGFKQDTRTQEKELALARQRERGYSAPKASKILQPKVDYAKIKRLQAVQRQKITELKRHMLPIF